MNFTRLPNLSERILCQFEALSHLMLVNITDYGPIRSLQKTQKTLTLESCRYNYGVEDQSTTNVTIEKINCAAYYNI